VTITPGVQLGTPQPAQGLDIWNPERYLLPTDDTYGGQAPRPIFDADGNYYGMSDPLPSAGSTPAGFVVPSGTEGTNVFVDGNGNVYVNGVETITVTGDSGADDSDYGQAYMQTLMRARTTNYGQTYVRAADPYVPAISDYLYRKAEANGLATTAREQFANIGFDNSVGQNARLFFGGVRNSVASGVENLGTDLGILPLSDATIGNGMAYLDPTHTSRDFTNTFAKVGTVFVGGEGMIATEANSGYMLMYRGDATAQTSFLSSYAQANGIDASNALIANAEQQGLVSQMFEDHSITSAGSPFVGVSSSEGVAQAFARGVEGTQDGYVTAFQVPNNYAAPNFENWNASEYEFLVPTQIDMRYMVYQYQVPPR
jgi:hypothetical protein